MFMKKIIYLTGLTAALFSCATKPKETVAENRMEITPFIVTQVILRDTTQERTDSTGKVLANNVASAFGKYEILNEEQFEQLQAAVWALVNDPKSKVYAHGTASVASSQKEIRERLIECDSMKEASFDAQGNEIITSKFACDSTSTVLGIKMIRFCESWYFNKETNMVEKDILGYSVLTYVPQKQAFKPLFYVYRDEEATKKAKKNDFY